MMDTGPVRIPVLFMALLFSACIADENKDTTAASIPVANKAIPMKKPHEPGSPYTLYGIKLGESKVSVEDKYDLTLCRQDEYYLRCMASLNTSGVNGITDSASTTVFISFKDNHVYSMGIPIFAPSMPYARDRLVELYGPPVSNERNTTSWSNDGGSIMLEASSRKGRPSAVNYSINPVN